MDLKNIVDTHFHLLSLEERGVDVFSLLTSLRNDGWGGGTDVAVAPDDIEKRIRFKEKFREINLSLGSGPWGTEEGNKSIDEQLKIEVEMLEKYKENISFIGEIGLDNFHKSYGEKRVQEELFIRQIELANLYNLPIIIHSREAIEQTARIISEHTVLRGGIFHCFSANSYLLKKALDNGFYISFAGPLTYKNSTSLRSILTSVPKDRLLFETDSPYLPPHPFRGEVNTPDKVSYVYETATSILGIEREELALIVKSNYERILGKNDS